VRVLLPGIRGQECVGVGSGGWWASGRDAAHQLGVMHP